VIAVGDVEGVLVQRPDRRALVDVDVLDAEVGTQVQERDRRRVGELPAARAGVPLGGVELDALDPVLGVVGLELAQAGVTVRVKVSYSSTEGWCFIDDSATPKRAASQSSPVVFLSRMQRIYPQHIFELNSMKTSALFVELLYHHPCYDL
jgi:hypothetical protein